MERVHMASSCLGAAGSEAISGGTPKTPSKCCTHWNKVSNQISDNYLLLTLCTSSNPSSLPSNTFANFQDGHGIIYGKWHILQMKSGPAILWYVYLHSHIGHTVTDFSF